MSMIIGVTWASLELLLTDEELDDVDGADPATHAHALKCLHVPCNLPWINEAELFFCNYMLRALTNR